jgi:hypothetical protein
MTNRAMLVEQLSAALKDLRSGKGDVFEVAVLAGLLDRHRGTNPDVLLEAERWRDGEGSDLLDDAIAHLPVRDMADRVVDAEPDDEPEQRMDSLLELDEACAALYWCCAEGIFRDEIGLVARIVDAFPESWLDLADLASAFLCGDDAPHREDPVYWLWAAVEATQWSNCQNSVVESSPDLGG